MSAVEAGITVGGLAGMVAGGKVGYSIGGWAGTLVGGPLGLVLGAVAGVTLLMQVARLAAWWSARREYRRLSPRRKVPDDPSRDAVPGRSGSGLFPRPIPLLGWPRFCCRMFRGRYYKRFWLLMTEVIMALILTLLIAGLYRELRAVRWIEVAARSAMMGAAGYLLVIFDRAVMRYYRRRERFFKRYRK